MLDSQMHAHVHGQIRGLFTNLGLCIGFRARAIGQPHLTFPLPIARGLALMLPSKRDRDPAPHQRWAPKPAMPTRQLAEDKGLT